MIGPRVTHFRDRDEERKVIDAYFQGCSDCLLPAALITAFAFFSIIVAIWILGHRYG